MTSPGGPATPSDSPRSQLQGAALIAVAVVIGLVLLLRGFGEEGGLISAGDSTTTTTVAEEEPNGSTTTTTLATRPPAQVTVLVANGTGAAGVAATKAAVLTSRGYSSVDTANAATTSTSVVYYADGYEAEAEAVAQALSIPASSVTALPTPPPFDTRGSNVVVVVGTDQS